MQIYKFEFKNINSFSEEWISIDFIELSKIGYFNLIQGEVGSGKSTIKDAISLALYGKVEGRNKLALPNRQTQKAETKIWLKSNNKNLFIHRGITPNFLKLEVDGVEDKNINSNLVKYQSFIEEEYFDIPYVIFKNILVLSINVFKSFLIMDSLDRRAIADNLFGFTILNSIKENTKQEKKILKESIDKTDTELSLINSNIESLDARGMQIEKRTKDTLTEELTIKTKEFKFLSIALKKINNLYNKNLNKKEIVNSDMSERLNELNSRLVDSNNNKKMLRLLDSEFCPTCNTVFDADKKESKKTEIMKEIFFGEIVLDSITKEYNESLADYNKLALLSVSNYQNKTDTQFKIDKLASDILEIETSLNVSRNDVLDEICKMQSENKILSSNLENLLIELNEEFNFINIYENLVSDSGLKANILKSILPQLNTQILKLMRELNLPYRIKFDETFSCVITSMGAEIDATSMSTGERKISDFVCILSILQILRSKYPSTNLLFLDEIYVGLDDKYIYEISKLLNKISNEENIHTFVINHSSLPLEFFDHHFQVVKTNNQSKINKLI